MKILSQFRKNARENLTSASKKIQVPISTIYDRLRKYEGSIIRKHTSLIDFGALGFGLKVQMVVKVAPKDRESLSVFLKTHPRVNSLYTISNGFDFMVEIILRNLLEVAKFNRGLDRFAIVDRHEFYVVEDIKKEDFLCDYETIDKAFDTQEVSAKL